jgi:hypothetical protein
VRVASARRSPLEAALSARGHEVLPLNLANRADVLWCSKSTRHVVSPKVVDAARRVNPALKVVMWDGDVRRTPPDHVTSLGGRIDLLLVGHESDAQASMLTGVGVKKVAPFYHGIDPACFPPPAGPGRGVFFGGSNYLGRDDEYPLSKFRAGLVEAFHRSGIVTNVLGNYWSAGKQWAPVQESLAYCRAMQRAAVTLGTNHFDLPRYYTKRLFDSLAAGRLHLTRYVPGMERDFRNHVHLAWFRDVDEALDLARWYLTHDRERERVAAAGRRVMMDYHRFCDRARELEVILKGVTGEA